MRWVPTAAVRPARCAAIPFIGGNDELGYIDTGSELDGFDNHVYISVRAVHEMANMIGRPTREQFQEVVESNIHFSQRLDEVTRERDELLARFDAIDVIESADFRARKKTGRKPVKRQEHEEEVAA